MSDYVGQRIALLTQHGKERVIAPVLENALGCRVRHFDGFDTDLLGTFTRDIPRFGTQLETARKKARIGMELSGLPLGLASEGSFGPDPFAGMFPWNVEFLIWVDDLHGLEVVGVAQGKANFAHLLARDWAAAEAFARQWGFPEHHLVVRPEGEDCGAPTREPQADVLGCVKCPHRVTRERTDRNTADPGRCGYCNP